MRIVSVIFLTITICRSFIILSQSLPPGIANRNIHWPKDGPVEPQVFGSGVNDATQTDQEKSGEDWWYAVKNQLMAIAYGESPLDRLDKLIHHYENELRLASNDLVKLYLDSNYMDSTSFALTERISIERTKFMIPYISAERFGIGFELFGYRSKLCRFNFTYAS